LNEPDPMLEPSIAMPRVKAYAPAEAPPVTSGLNPSVTGGTADSVALKFRQALLRHVARFQRYPNAAGEPDPEGKVDVRFSMDRDGMLLGVWVTTGSGPSVLDREAIETIRRAQPLPPIPRELPDRLNVHLQLVFAPS
jgi:protein TonB